MNGKGVNYLKVVELMMVSVSTLLVCVCLCGEAQVNCSGDEFNCGSVVKLSYPFWGGSRPLGCGKQGFQMVCQEGVPILNISSLSYRVESIDFDSSTLIIARQDLLSSNRCPKIHVNTTMDNRLFEYPPDSTDQWLTLYYHCSAGSLLPNFFRCGDGGINLFYAGTGSPGSGISCSNSISVPINKDDARTLKHPTSYSINTLQHALDSGFSIRWHYDPNQNSSAFCNRDVYGSCIKYSIRPCNYFDRCTRDAPNHQDNLRKQPAAAPPNYQQPGHGMPPIQSASSPNYDQTDVVMPPAQNVGYFPWNFTPDDPRTGNGSNARKNSSNKVFIVVTLCVASVAVASIIIGCFIKRRHSPNAHNQESNQYVEKFLLQHGSLTPKRYKYSEIKKITKSFSDQLGQGGYGSVYKGMLRDGCIVAVKVLTEIDSSNGEEFFNEVASISRTSHVNIVSLLGFCSEGSKRALVYEYMPNKSLDKFLSNKTTVDGVNCSLDMQNLYKIAVGIAKGLEYLHTGCSTRIVHFDIKPQNILLDEDMCPKISDFGLAKLCKRKQSVLSVLGTRGTIGYIAPEVFSRNFGGVSYKSDVYSYGMMLLEMLGENNVVVTHNGIGTASSENYFPDKLYEQVILDVTKKLDDFMIEEEEDEEMMRKKMLVIGFWCIQTIPSDRPSMTRVGEMLEGSLQSIQIPPKPFLFTPNLPDQEMSSASTPYVETENSDQDLIQLSISIK